jgi:S-adenosylmethionine decarboxylase
VAAKDSESSLFVFAHKLILKTCGTTTLLAGIAPILELAHKAGFVYGDVYRVFYSRKSFMFPERQRSPHGSWAEEVQRLNSYFENGDAYVIGSLIGDHWYLYLTSPRPSSRSSSPLPSPIFSPFSTGTQDETLEILMTQLDSVNAQKFYLNGTLNTPEEGHISGSIMAEACGLSTIYPVDPCQGGCLDGYSFAPCGFSANAVIAAPQQPKRSGHYFTVHVTPEQGYSYASFETNVPEDMFPARGTREVVSHVVKGFLPGRMSITKFISHRRLHNDDESDCEFGGDSGFVEDVRNSSTWDWKVQGYRRIEKVIYEFDGYDLIFASFVRND